MDSTLTVSLQQALVLFKSLRIEDIRDIRSVDMDLLMVMRNGQRIVLTEGALIALREPDLGLVFKDGALRIEQIFRQVEHIELYTPKGKDDHSSWQEPHHPDTSVQSLYTPTHEASLPDAQLPPPSWLI